MTEQPTGRHPSYRLLAALIVAGLACYAAAAWSGALPDVEAHEPPDPTRAEQPLGGGEPPPPPIYAVVPFALLLGAIAVLPLVEHTAHWWESNLNRFYVAATAGLLALTYYLLVHGHPVVRHFLAHSVAQPATDGPSWNLAWVIVQNAIFQEYIPFITVLFALYAITGGIRIEGDLPAHPRTNTAFLALGGALASFIGTTGAAMLLIRPLLDTNRERKHVVHTVVFFIFIVCNCGGCLLPIGDPPLFLGYLHGVDFLWTLWNLWPQWLVVNVILLIVYHEWDRRFAYPREAPADLARDETRTHALRFAGLQWNVPLLIGVVLAAALLDPTKPFPGTHWHPWLYLREAVMLGLVAASLAGAPHTRYANDFHFAPIVEVAVLFLGIFICMQPALQILDARGAELGIDSALKFFWATGTLSSVLDNAPTYLVFFEAARSVPTAGVREAGVDVGHLAAISTGAVFLGAMTYIGNGPNFMVKSVAESTGVRMPSFFGYLVYSFLVLVPILVVVSLLSSWLLWS